MCLWHENRQWGSIQSSRFAQLSRVFPTRMFSLSVEWPVKALLFSTCSKVNQTTASFWIVRLVDIQQVEKFDISRLTLHSQFKKVWCLRTRENFIELNFQFNICCGWDLKKCSIWLVSKHIVCKRLSVMQQLAWVRRFCAQKNFTLFLVNQEYPPGLELLMEKVAKNPPPQWKVDFGFEVTKNTPSLKMKTCENC